MCIILLYIFYKKSSYLVTLKYLKAALVALGSTWVTTRVTTKMGNYMTEDQIQAKFYREAYNKYPQIRGFLFSVPNGSTRHILEAQKLKATGLTPGIPDMICVYNGLLALEFKTDAGVLSPAQRVIHERWTTHGIQVHVVRTSDEALFLLHHHLNKGQ